MAPQPPRRTTIAPINNAKNRRVTFAKRRNGIFKKAYELGVLCSCEIVVVIRDVRGRVHQFSAVFPDESARATSAASDASIDDDQVSALLPREPTSIVPRAHTDDGGRLLAKIVAGEAGPVAESRGPSFYDKGKPPMFVIGGESNAGDEDEEEEDLADGSMSRTVTGRDWPANSSSASTGQQHPSFGALLSTYSPPNAPNVPSTATTAPAPPVSRTSARSKSSASRTPARKRGIPASASLSPPFTSQRAGSSQLSPLEHQSFQHTAFTPPFAAANPIGMMGYHPMQGEHPGSPFMSLSQEDSTPLSNPQSSTPSLSSMRATSMSSGHEYPTSASSTSVPPPSASFALYPSPHISPVSVATGASPPTVDPFAAQALHSPTPVLEHHWQQHLATWPMAGPPVPPNMPAANNYANHGAYPDGSAVAHFTLNSPVPPFHPANAFPGHMSRRSASAADSDRTGAGSQSSAEPSSIVEEPFLSFLDQHFQPDKSPES